LVDDSVVLKQNNPKSATPALSKGGSTPGITPLVESNEKKAQANPDKNDRTKTATDKGYLCQSITSWMTDWSQKAPSDSFMISTYCTYQPVRPQSLSMLRSVIADTFSSEYSRRKNKHHGTVHCAHPIVHTHSFKTRPRPGLLTPPISSGYVTRTGT
jgi:hypothetical protein